ncbi:MAG: SpaH/EbpB family LPXTG-anchored major pilin [Chordicoccus sp.]
MKHLKKLAALLLAVVMTMAMSMTAFAADPTTYTLILTGTTTGHTYEAYQIFTGDLSGTALSNIKWGTGVKDTDNLVAALKADDTLKATFSSVTDAASAAEALSNAKDDDAVAQAFATVVSQYLSSTKTTQDSAADNTEIKGLTAGYYLVKDQDDSLKTEDQDAYTRFILKVVANASAAVKSSVPTVEKKVKDTNDSTGETTGWQDSADYDIGDSVPYQITGSMPSTIADYTTYKYEFTDTMSQGLTYTANTATITVGGETAKIGDAGSFTETVTPNKDDTTTVTWACADLKALAKALDVTLDENTKVVVTYNATLNNSAVIGSAGNQNTVYLTYSNNPNKGGDGNTGKTPEDKNIVFTYKTVVNKKDQSKNSLAGAGFTLLKKTTEKDKEGKPIGEALTDKDGNAVKDKDGNQVYVKTIKTYQAGTETTFKFTGLDDGDYILKETTTPAGYNTIDPVEFTISATHDETADDPKFLTLSGDVTSGTAKFAADTNAGSLTTDIINKKGATLPSTGGVGTRMFYAFGGCLVAAAVVLLALKKRKEA